MSHREIGMPAFDEALLGLLDMARQLRGARSLRELEFMLVNDSRRLLPYRQAALWLAPHGLRALSGIVQIGYRAADTGQELNKIIPFIIGANNAKRSAIEGAKAPIPVARRRMRLYWYREGAR